MVLYLHEYAFREFTAFTSIQIRFPPSITNEKENGVLYTKSKFVLKALESLRFDRNCTEVSLEVFITCQLENPKVCDNVRPFSSNNLGGGISPLQTVL
jgi:hypothetical protein